jgi:hypothetical protein
VQTEDEERHSLVAALANVHQKVPKLVTAYATLQSHSYETQELLVDGLARNNSFLFILHIAYATGNMSW